MSSPLFLLLVVAVFSCTAAPIIRPAATVLVTGATGRTGRLTYHGLKSVGYNVRGLDLNRTFASSVLGCGACTPEQGFWEANVTHGSGLAAPMKGVDALVIITSSVPIKLPNGSYGFPVGGYPQDVDFVGGQNQIRAALAAGVKHILLCSSMGTTTPNSFLDLLGNGQIGFYKLNEEAFLMSSAAAAGVDWTIIKPGGLTDDAGGNATLRIGSEDSLQEPTNMVTRADLAAVFVHAVQNRAAAANLRFDLGSSPGAATKDFKALFASARELMA